MLSFLIQNVTRLKDWLIKPISAAPKSGIAALALFCSAFVFHTVPSQAQQNLPDLGEPADNTLSIKEEELLGEQFMRQIRAQLPLVRDVQLNEYIQELGNRLVLASGKGESRTFTFFLIDDPQINAFAIPGGYIGVNSGLVEAMAVEEQLASVIAHEVAHVTQRHHARSFATGNRATCLLYTSPSPRDKRQSRMPSSA